MTRSAKGRENDSPAGIALRGDPDLAMEMPEPTTNLGEASPKPTNYLGEASPKRPLEPVCLEPV